MAISKPKNNPTTDDPKDMINLLHLPEDKGIILVPK
jgi:hypothetical protein